MVSVPRHILLVLAKLMRCCMVLTGTCHGAAGSWTMHGPTLCVCCVTSELLLNSCDLHQAVRGQFTAGLYPAGGLHARSQQPD